jgi:ribosomal protein S27AE
MEDLRRRDRLEAEETMNVNDECPVCKNGTLEQNDKDLVCRGECGGCFSAEFQLGYAAGHSAGRRSHPASRSFMQSLQHEVALIAAALENPDDLTDAELVQVIGDLEQEIEETP